MDGLDRWRILRLHVEDDIPLTAPHALAGSPAIDASGPETDQRGVARPQGEGPDAGAFELEVA